MAIWANLHLEQDVITLRLSYLSRSESFRQDVLKRLSNGEDPFHIKDFEVDGIEVGIVSDEPHDFAAKLDALLGSDSGAAYLEQEEQLAAPGVRDTSDNRAHIWAYWGQQAHTNEALRELKRQFDKRALGRGPVHFTGEYTLPDDAPPTIELWEAIKSNPSIASIYGFRGHPRNWGKLERREKRPQEPVED